jgi:hypothetical protein
MHIADQKKTIAPKNDVNSQHTTEYLQMLFAMSFLFLLSGNARLIIMLQCSMQYAAAIRIAK